MQNSYCDHRNFDSVNQAYEVHLTGLSLIQHFCWGLNTPGLEHEIEQLYQECLEISYTALLAVLFFLCISFTSHLRHKFQIGEASHEIDEDVLH